MSEVLTTALDYYSGQRIDRPNKEWRKYYDFDFKKKEEDEWIYMNSSNDIDEFDEQIECTESSNGLWRIVDARTGKVVKNG